MKRFWLSISIVVLVLLLVSGGLLWFVLGRTADPAAQPRGLGAIKQELSRGYHTAALLKLLKDQDPEQVLLVVQNDWELRATGGFMTAFGDGQIVDGQLQNFRVVPSEYFDPEISLAPPMPSGLSYRISTPTLTMRDANWDVDFATTAATVSRYYTDATGLTPDLVIAITTKSAERILDHIGPLTFTVNGHELTVTGSTVTQILEDYTDQSFRDLGLEWETRKQVLSSFAEALLPRLHDLAFGSPTDLLRLTNELLGSYDVQVWSNQPTLASHLTALGTSQRVTASTNQDALLIVDTNVGARKTNRVMDQRADYRVDLTGDKPTSTLHLTYTHNGSFEPTIIQYYDTVRVYAPIGSVLTASDGLTNVTSYVRHGRTVFEGRFVVQPGASKTITLEYTLGAGITARTVSDYRLQLERQPGALAYPVQVTVFDGSQTATIGTDVARDRTLLLEPN